LIWHLHLSSNIENWNKNVIGNILHGGWEEWIEQCPPVDLIFTSPPYNIGKKADESKLSRRNGKFDAVSWAGIKGYEDKMPESEYQQWQADFLRACGKVIKPSGSIIYNHKERNKSHAVIRPSDWFPADVLTHRQTIVWDRQTTHNHDKSYVYPTVEFIYWLTRSQDERSKVYFKNEGKGQVWSIPKETMKNKHPAPFPLELARLVIRMFSPPNGLVLDPFSGSGTTALAAVMEGRQYIGIEKRSEFVDMSKGRIKQYLEETRKA